MKAWYGLWRPEVRGGLYELQSQEQPLDGQQDFRPLDQSVSGGTSTLVTYGPSLESLLT